MATGIDVVARALGAKGVQGAALANKRLDELPNGMTYIGEVDYYTDLPTTNVEVGYVYSVKYKGTSPSTELSGRKYVWGKSGDINQWIPVDPDDSMLGTVKSVNAGTGLTVSGDATVNPTIGIHSNYKLPTNVEWAEKQPKMSAGTGININNNTISTKIPECPTGIDGEFFLKCTVASGVATYSWVNMNDLSYEYMTVLKTNRIENVTELIIDNESTEVGAHPIVYGVFADESIMLISASDLVYAKDGGSYTNLTNEMVFESGTYIFKLKDYNIVSDPVTIG